MLVLVYNCINSLFSSENKSYYCQQVIKLIFMYNYSQRYNCFDYKSEINNIIIYFYNYFIFIYFYFTI